MIKCIYIYIVKKISNNYIITGAKDERGSFRLAYDSQIIRNLLASAELLLSEIEGLFA